MVKGVKVCPVCGGYMTCRTDVAIRQVFGVTAMVHRACQSPRAKEE